MTGQIVSLGSMDYRECFDLQRQILSAVAAGTMPDTLLFVEHPPVYTLGANFHADNLPLPESEYERLGVAIEKTDRGGDITYHGPRQLVAYPIFLLDRHGKDLHRWLRELEETVIVALASFGIEGRRFPPHTGVWVEDRKVAAIGIKVKRWTSMHGIALNCDNDLRPFEWIVPCGIRGYGVTSLSKELGRPVGVEEAGRALHGAFERIFGISLLSVDRSAFLGTVGRLSDDERRAPVDA